MIVVDGIKAHRRFKFRWILVPFMDQHTRLRLAVEFAGAVDRIAGKGAVERDLLAAGLDAETHVLGRDSPAERVRNGS